MRCTDRPTRFDLPDDDSFEILANRSFTGSGDFLVNRGTGRPDTFEDLDLDGDGLLDTDTFTLRVDEGQRWYRFTTLGDGSAGDVIRLSPTAFVESTVTIRATDGTLVWNGAGYDVSLIGDTLRIGGPSDDVAVMELDISRFLQFRQDLEQLDLVELVLELQQSVNFNLPDTFDGLTVVGTTLYFTGVDADNGLALWKTDGTISGTGLVATLAAEPDAMFGVDGTLYLTIDGALWVSDGSTLTQLKTFVAGPETLTAFGASVVFVADDGANGRELWISDGTVPGTMHRSPTSTPAGDADPAAVDRGQLHGRRAAVLQRPRRHGAGPVGHRRQRRRARRWSALTRRSMSRAS